MLRLFLNPSTRRLVEVEERKFRVEKDIQNLIENNLDEIFGLDFICSEFSVGRYRLDSLAFDKRSNSFVIVEYKKGTNFSVSDQGRAYLNTMKERKSDFIVEYARTAKKSVEEIHIDWDKSKLILIAPHFTPQQQDAIRNTEVELWTIRAFANGSVILESLSPNKPVRGDKPSPQPRPPIGDIGEMQELWEELEQRLNNFFDTELKKVNHQISWRKKNMQRVYCTIQIKKAELRIEMQRGDKPVHGMHNKLFTLNDPQGLANIVSSEYTKQNGDKYERTVYRISLTKRAFLDDTMDLLQQRYDFKEKKS